MCGSSSICAVMRRRMSKMYARECERVFLIKITDRPRKTTLQCITSGCQLLSVSRSAEVGKTRARYLSGCLISIIFFRSTM